MSDHWRDDTIEDEDSMHKPRNRFTSNTPNKRGGRTSPGFDAAFDEDNISTAVKGFNEREQFLAEIDETVAGMETAGDSQDSYGPSSKKGKVDHQVYGDTYYIPNDKSRILEIPMNSALYF